MMAAAPLQQWRHFSSRPVLAMVPCQQLHRAGCCNNKPQWQKSQVSWSVQTTYCNSENDRSQYCGGARCSNVERLAVLASYIRVIHSFQHLSAYAVACITASHERVQMMKSMPEWLLQLLSCPGPQQCAAWWPGWPPPHGAAPGGTPHHAPPPALPGLTHKQTAPVPRPPAQCHYVTLPRR